MKEKHSKSCKMCIFFYHRIKITVVIVLVAGCVLFAGITLAEPTGQKAPATTIRFEDVTEKMGLTGFVNSADFWAVAWGDFDNDGWVDLYVPGGLWRNDRGVRFIKVEGPPSASDVQQISGIWGDYDNDGYLDLYCFSTQQIPSAKLYRNIKGKKFIDVTEKMKIPHRPMKTCLGAAWGDFNSDGYLDLYVGGYGGDGGGYQPDCILMNDAGKSFKLTWKTKDKNRPARGIIACDFDEDGDLDVYVSNYRLVPNLLWVNDGKGGFKEVAKLYGVAGDGDLGAWGHTIGSAWGDLDNDGLFDLFVGNFSHPPAYQDRPKFYRNLGPDGKFHFKDLSKKVGLRWQESYATPALADFNNDGYLDFFLTTSYTGGNVLYRNNGDWSFTEVTGEANIVTGPNEQAAWADYDNDGDLDLFTGGKFFQNQGSRNNWLKVRIEGNGKVNRSGIGTQVRIKTKNGILTRQVEGATGEGNQNDLTLHFGLGSRKEPVELLITWPGGQKQNVTSPVNRFVKVKMSPASTIKKKQGNSKTN